jgi:hypothetical protein
MFIFNTGDLMKIKSLLIALFVFGLPLKSMAVLTWSAAQTVNTIMQDDCGGGSTASVTVMYFTGDASTAYYFPTSVQSSSAWISELQTALATGLKVNLKYESTSSAPGASCTFNSGYVIHIVNLNP